MDSYISKQQRLFFSDKRFLRARQLLLLVNQSPFPHVKIRCWCRMIERCFSTSMPGLYNEDISSGTSVRDYYIPIYTVYYVTSFISIAIGMALQTIQRGPNNFNSISQFQVWFSGKIATFYLFILFYLRFRLFVVFWGGIWGVGVKSNP